MSSIPKVPIHILSYNHGRFLGEAIESALAQTYDNIEIIVADDGSSDNSLAIAEAYAARYPHLVRVITHPGRANRGISATVNLCWDNATGTYLQGLASDDVLHPRKVAEQIELLERHPELGWIYGYAIYVDEHNKPLPEVGLFGVDITRGTDPLEKLIFGNAICGMTVLMRRSAVMDLDPHDETLVYGDWDFWIRFASRHKMGFLPHIRARARIHGYNTSIGISDEAQLRNNLEVMKKLRREAGRLGGGLARPRTQALLDLQCSFCSYGIHDEESSRLHLSAAFKSDPTLEKDPRYFSRWLSRCQGILRGMPQPERSGDFASWVLATLPESVGKEFVRAAARRFSGGVLGAAHEYFDRAKAYWEHRRSVLDSLLHDDRIWHERELFSLHAASFMAAVRGDLRRVVRRSRSRRLFRRDNDEAPL